MTKLAAVSVVLSGGIAASTLAILFVACAKGLGSNDTPSADGEPADSNGGMDGTAPPEVTAQDDASADSTSAEDGSGGDAAIALDTSTAEDAGDGIVRPET